MSLYSETAERYDVAIAELEVQITLPALATVVSPQQDYNRRKKMEQTGKEPTKHTAGLKRMVEELREEKRNVLQGIQLTCEYIKRITPDYDVSRIIGGNDGT